MCLLISDFRPVAVGVWGPLLQSGLVKDVQRSVGDGKFHEEMNYLKVNRSWPIINIHLERINETL